MKWLEKYDGISGTEQKEDMASAWIAVPALIGTVILASVFPMIASLIWVVFIVGAAIGVLRL